MNTIEKLDNIPDEKLPLAKRNVKRYASREDYTIDPFFSDCSCTFIINGVILKDIIDFTVITNFSAASNALDTLFVTRYISAYKVPAIFDNNSFFVVISSNEKNNNISYTCGYIHSAKSYERFASMDNIVSKNNVEYSVKYCALDEQTTADVIKAWAEYHADLLENIEINNIAEILYVKLRTKYADKSPKIDNDDFTPIYTMHS